MGKFGWSYPPGCSGPPDDGDDICIVCGKTVDDCICPECPECGTAGDPACYQNHGLVLTQEQIDSKEKFDQDCAEQLRRDNEAYDLYKEEEK